MGGDFLDDPAFSFLVDVSIGSFVELVAEELLELLSRDLADVSLIGEEHVLYSLAAEPLPLVEKDTVDDVTRAFLLAALSATGLLPMAPSSSLLLPDMLLVEVTTYLLINELVLFRKVNEDEQAIHLYYGTKRLSFDRFAFRLWPLAHLTFPPKTRFSLHSAQKSIKKSKRQLPRASS